MLFRCAPWQRPVSVDEMPVIVANDIYGGDVYSIGRERYRRPRR